MAKKVSLQLAEEIFNAGLDITNKKISKAQYDKSYNATILGINQDFTDDIAEEEQQTLIKKYSIPEVPDKDNYYTFKINGNYYVKSSNTSFKLYENIKIRVPNGNWDNMYIEVQRDTEAYPKWITSVEEPTVDIVEGDYWIKIDDEKLRNIIEVRRYTQNEKGILSWEVIEYRSESLFTKPYSQHSEPQNKSAELKWGRNAGSGDCNIFNGSFNVVGKLYALYGVDCEAITFEDAIADVEDFDYLGDSEIRFATKSDSHSLYNISVALPVAFALSIEDDVTYVLGCGSDSVMTGIDGSNDNNINHDPVVAVIPFTSKDVSSALLSLKNIRFNKDEYQKTPYSHLSWTIYRLFAINGSGQEQGLEYGNSIVSGFNNYGKNYSIISGHSNAPINGGSLIIGDYNKGAGRHKENDIYSFGGSTQNWTGTTKFGYQHSGIVNIGRKNQNCRFAIGDDNLNAYVAIGNHNRNWSYIISDPLEPEGFSERIKCDEPYMFGHDLVAGCQRSSYFNDETNSLVNYDTPMAFYFGRHNARTYKQNNIVETFGWGYWHENYEEWIGRNIKTLDTSGNLGLAGSVQGVGGDYAEYYEWVDGNINNEDRRGLFVTLEGRKIKLASPSDNYLLGAISSTPTIVGNTAGLEWQGKYKKDIFECYLKDDNGSYIISDDFDREALYLPREMRQEYAPVGTHGQLIVIDDGTCEVNGYCGVGQNGIGTQCNDMEKVYEGLAFRVTERLDDTHIRITIK